MVREREPKSFGHVSGLEHECGIFDLREIHDPGVVPEIHVTKFRVLLDAKSAKHQRVGMPREIVGEIEGAKLGFGHRREYIGARKKLITVIAADTQEVFALTQSIEMAACATVGIAKEHGLALDSTLGQYSLNLADDLVWPIVEGCRQPSPIDVDPKLVDDSTELSRQRAAADDQ